jgi:hypothetical protein
VLRYLLTLVLLPVVADSQVVPRWEDFRITTDLWHGPNAPLKLLRPDEQMFRTQLLNGAKERSNFAGHYRFAGWACGSACAAGAFIDLESGEIHRRPR